MSDHDQPKPFSQSPRSDNRAETVLIDIEFGAFYRETVKGLVGFLVLQGALLSDAADIAQDTMGEAYRLWDTISHPRAWSYRVASRSLIRRLATVEQPNEETPEPSPLLRNSSFEGWEQSQDAIRLLQLLPPRQRQVMAWTLYGYTPTEIAHEICIEPTAVRSNLKKARRALARHLRDQEEDQ
ncbi:RNA polymerase sigma factor [Amycolatopsis sp. cmx-11-12]|uniref:RNA polymerase sigma factor n=1 Tax=Amycolatopsis sp. cmx-11-12 TaxID=2785795 RepID=UPI003918003F